MMHHRNHTGHSRTQSSPFCSASECTCSRGCNYGSMLEAADQPLPLSNRNNTFHSFYLLLTHTYPSQPITVRLALLFSTCTQMQSFVKPVCSLVTSIIITSMRKQNRSKSEQLNKMKVDNLDSLSRQSLPMIMNQLVPKHLLIRNKKRVFSLHNIQYKESPADRIDREKKKYLKPLSDVELIMKKFDQVAYNKQLSNDTPRPNLKLEDRYATDLEKRIKTLLTLPTVRNIKEKVQKSRNFLMTEPQTATLAILNQGTRLSILKKYEDYIKNASKPATRKLKTDYI